MIIHDIDAQCHFWVTCTCTQSQTDGRKAVAGRRYFVLFSWGDHDCGPCADHPNCTDGALTLAGLGDGNGELFCAADFEPVPEAEDAELMQAMLDVGVAFGERAAA